MTTQVSFTTDEDLKNKALEKAKNSGITLKTLLIYSMKAFVEGEISFALTMNENEPELEEVIFHDKAINCKAAKLAQLLK